MAKYKHVVSGARVEVRDDKVMDSSWEAVGDSEKKEPAKKTTASRSSSSKSE